jgi:hypothetical protein
MHMGDHSPDEAAELRRLSAATDFSFPGWKAELYPDVRQIAQTTRSMGEAANHIRTVNMGGPLVSDALSAVIAKLGFGLHYRHSGHIVPQSGGVEVRYETNASLIDRPFPVEVLS